jgi:hypothetical protein
VKESREEIYFVLRAGKLFKLQWWHRIEGEGLK